MVVLPATGVSVGVVQLVRGAAAQPAALRAALNGKRWDQVRRL